MIVEKFCCHCAGSFPKSTSIRQVSSRKSELQANIGPTSQKYTRRRELQSWYAPKLRAPKSQSQIAAIFCRKCPCRQPNRQPNRIRRPGGFLRAACLQNETAPEKLLYRYEKRFENAKKRSERRDRKCFSPFQAA